MSPIADTFEALLHKWPDAFGLWVAFSLAPLAILVTLALLYRPELPNRVMFVRTSLALVIGYPATLVLFVVVPLTTFNMFFVPVLFDAYPISRSVLAAPLAIVNWFARNAFWCAPICWLVWLFVAPIFLARKWLAHAGQG